MIDVSYPIEDSHRQILHILDIDYEQSVTAHKTGIDVIKDSYSYIKDYVVKSPDLEGKPEGYIIDLNSYMIQKALPVGKQGYDSNIGTLKGETPSFS